MIDIAQIQMLQVCLLIDAHCQHNYVFFRFQERVITVELSRYSSQVCHMRVIGFKESLSRIIIQYDTSEIKTL